MRVEMQKGIDKALADQNLVQKTIAAASGHLRFGKTSAMSKRERKPADLDAMINSGEYDEANLLIKTMRPQTRAETYDQSPILSKASTFIGMSSPKMA